MFCPYEWQERGGWFPCIYLGWNDFGYGASYFRINQDKSEGMLGAILMVMAEIVEDDVFNIDDGRRKDTWSLISVK